MALKVKKNTSNSALYIRFFPPWYINIFFIFLLEKTLLVLIEMASHIYDLDILTEKMLNYYVQTVETRSLATL